MTETQKVIKIVAIAFAILLSVSIIGGILSAFSFVDYFFTGDSDAVSEEIREYQISSQPDILEIEINAAAFTIKEDQKFSAESNLKYLELKESNGCLSIKDNKKHSGGYKDAVLELYIPKDTTFKKVSIKTGAGSINIDSLSAEKIDFDFGAGEVTINNLVALSQIDIDGGAGSIRILNGSLRDLDLDMGVGELDLTSSLTGKCRLELGIGESDITIIGNKEDYTFDIDNGIGTITLDGMNVSNLNGYGNGVNSIDIDGGIGKVVIKFKSPDAD